MLSLGEIVRFLFQWDHDYKNHHMSQDYAAIVGSTLAAIMVVGAVEVANSLRSIDSTIQKLRILFLDEIKDGAMALRAGVALPAPRAREVKSRMRIYKMLRRKVNRALRVLYFVWGAIFTLSSALLMLVLEWSSLEKSTPGIATAYLSLLGCKLAIALLFGAFLFRVAALRVLTEWEERVDIARRMNLPVAQSESLMRMWARHNKIVE
ncbi:hypothetical protein ACWCPK_38615 [Streptomyces sp. NPDC001953]